jgi:hypothetical protein
MREICASGSVGGEGGNAPRLPGGGPAAVGGEAGPRVNLVESRCGAHGTSRPSAVKVSALPLFGAPMFVRLIDMSATPLGSPTGGLPVARTEKGQRRLTHQWRSQCEGGDGSMISIDVFAKSVRAAWISARRTA